MSGDEFTRAIRERVWTGENGQPLEMAPDIFREFLHRGVTSFRFFSQRLEQDVIQISGQTAAQLVDGRVASATDCCRSWRMIFGRACFTSCIDSREGDTGFERLC